MTAKIVIASAKRLIAVRQPWRKRYKIAEIRVPAWPIPTHHTKLTIAQPQPTGLLSPHNPIPSQTRYPIAPKRAMSNRFASPKAIYHSGGVGEIGRASCREGESVCEVEDASKK